MKKVRKRSQIQDELASQFTCHEQKTNWFAKLSGTAAVFMVIAAVFGLLWSSNFITLDKAAAAEQKVETVNLRIIGTTDLHGQLNSKDYEQGVDYNNGGLARVMDLITRTREELPKENTITLDAGDVLYDYTTEYIFSESQEEIQPIYQAMAMVGYDAITLGNHDFDYGYEYILRQLNGSGLRGITVVSNVADSKTGEFPFLENMMITRRMKTASGNEVEVKVGIIGQTIPSLTAKTHSYAGILKTEDMVINAQKQAIKLKEMGADIIIALSHTGIGPQTPELNFKNVAYALTLIPEIDVVVSGHEHNLFPTNDMTSSYYKLPNVDKKTYLINGKNVVMAGDRGKAIGVVDLTLEVNEDSIEIAERSSELRRVTADNTKENSRMAAMYGYWEEKLLEYSTEILGELDKNMVIQNYYGLLGDNTAIQLLNNSKMHYALKFVNTTGKSYKNYPIIAASTYASFGVNSVQDYINIRDKITESDLSAIQPYNSYLYIYTITGKQLREWLEWTASAYETIDGTIEWEDSTMASLMKTNKLKSLIREEWLDDWNSFYVFDGIDYVIQPTEKPRYDLSGNRINSTRRITNIKYNGIEVTDDMTFLLATNKITIPTEANQGVEKQVALNGFVRSQSVLGKYIEQISKSGEIVPVVDNSWTVSVPKDYRFLVKVPYYADSLFKSTPWYNSSLTQEKQYNYYIASYPVVEGDQEGPNVLAAPLVTSATASSYEVGVFVSDASKIKQARMIAGEYDIDYNGWIVGKDVLNKTFTVWENGIYSIYAEDIYGNKTLKRLVIDNFNDNLLAKPTVNTYTNRKSKISGTAEPNTTIVFQAYTGLYQSKTDITGKFSYALPAQPSGTVVNVYLIDVEKGLESERVSIPVKRTGPNQPSLNPVYNNMNFIHGDTNDSDADVIAVVGDKVYVSYNGGKELYEKNTEIFNINLEIIETYAEVDDNGYYQILIPPLEAGSTVMVYNMDHLSRNSRAVSTKVIEVAPNAPILYEVSNIEKSVSGYVPSPAGKIYDITLAIGDHTYTTKTDKKGDFSFEFTQQLYAGQVLELTASDLKNGTVRNSFTSHITVKDIKDYISKGSSSLVLNRITSKSNLISGFYYDGGTVYLAIGSGEGDSFTNSLHMVDTDHLYKFRYELENKLESGTIIYVMTRFTDGRILKANMAEVLPGRPEPPRLLKEVTNTDKLVQVIADKDCEITLQIGFKTYVSTEYTYDEKNKQYLYSFATDRDVSGTPITITATNVSGTGEIFTSAIVKTAPDSPEVNTVKEGDSIVTGTIELLEFTAPVVKTGTTVTAGSKEEEIAEQKAKAEEEKLPSIFEDAPAKVVKTQTRIFAKIGKKTYEGTIDKKGKFTIKVPKQKAGTVIKVWGSNKAGRGPLVTVTVTDKQ